MVRAREGFEAFLRDVEPRLREALVARYGFSVGREVTVDALSYAWEHWERLRTMRNPVGYLYRVGQSASRRYSTDSIPWEAVPDHVHRDRLVDPELIAALGDLPEQQRTVVVLVHGLGWTHRGAAELLGIAPSTIQTHVERALRSLRITLETTDVH